MPEGTRVLAREVYETAVRGLGTLVSPRAANRLVDSALRSASRTPDDISSKAMQRLLLGRIRHELHGVLPGPALEAGLKRVASEVERRADQLNRARDAASQPGVGFQTRVVNPEPVKERAPRRGFNPFRRRTAAPAAEVVDGVDDFDDLDDFVASPESDHRTTHHDALLDPTTLSSHEAVRRSSVYLPGIVVPEELWPDNASGAALDAVDDIVDVVEDTDTLVVEAAPAWFTAAPVAPIASVTPLAALEPKRQLDDKSVEAAVKAFAEVETVRQIVISRGTKVLQTRGGGVDADRLAPLAVSTRALLERAGQLRVYSVELPGGVLFLFPLHDGTVSVLTQPNVNIGAVLAARAALEEAA